VVSDDQTHRVKIVLSDQELRTLRQALNEVLNGIDIFEFETRMGATRAEVDALLDRLESATLNAET
jgi:hypothetical protein